MASQHGKMTDDLLAFALAVSLIAILFSVAAFIRARGSAPNIISSIRQPSLSKGTAIIQVVFVIPFGRAVNLQASVVGQGYNISVPVKTYYIPTPSGGGYTNSSSQSAGSQIYGYYNNYDQYSIIFQGLEPSTPYNISLYGVSSPYCPPGSVCALGLALINQHATVMTGQNATITNVTFVLG